MGLLDDLRKKTSDMIEAERLAKEQQLQAERRYREEMLPVLKQIFTHLRELTQHLNYLKQELYVEYIVSADDLCATFQQQDYQLEIDSTQHTRQITLRFKCLGPWPISYHVADGRSLPKHLDFLNRHNLIYSCSPIKNDRHQIIRANIEIKPYIPISFVFVADIENSIIKLHISNFESLGLQSYNLYPADIGEHFYEDMGRYIIREKDRFLALEISDEKKQEIRQMVADEFAQREAELGKAMKSDSNYDKQRPRLKRGLR